MWSEQKLIRTQMPLVFLLILLVGSFNIYLAFTEAVYYEIVPDIFVHDITLNSGQEQIIVGYEARTEYPLVTQQEYDVLIQPIKEKYERINVIMSVGLLLYLILIFPRTKRNILKFFSQLKKKK